MTDLDLTTTTTTTSTTLATRGATLPARAYLASLTSPHSKRNMARYLDTIADMLMPGSDRETVPWSQLTAAHADAIRAALQSRYAPSTVNGHLAALRGVLKAARRLGLMTGEQYQAAADVPSVRGTTLPAGRDLQAGELRALVLACQNDTSAAGVRDAAMIGMLYTCGLRRSELVALTIDDYNTDTGTVTVRHGKGDKSRLVYATHGTQDAIADWLAVRGDLPGALFQPVNKAGRIQARAMRDQAVYKMLKKRAAQSGVADFSPHDFRRTFVGDLLDSSVDIVTVQKLAGHASVTTTGRYDRRPESVKQQAAQNLHFPYQSHRARGDY